MLAGLQDFLQAYRRYDPAAKSTLEIAFLYPGPRALFFYRIANWFSRQQLSLPRVEVRFRAIRVVVATN